MMEAGKGILRIERLGFPWTTRDPFLFCVYHADAYPEGDAAFGPLTSLGGRNLGNDFVLKDGWRMYHGKSIPGFPVHPHRGFETVTVVRKGMVDHSDSLGGAGRYGHGDVLRTKEEPRLQRAGGGRQDRPVPLRDGGVWASGFSDIRRRGPADGAAELLHDPTTRERVLPVERG